MPKYCCLLRAVNVGGHNKVPMAVYKEILQALGAVNIETYLNSGNAVFDVKNVVAAKMAEQVQRQIKFTLGLNIGVWVLTRKDLQEIVDENPLQQQAAEFPSRTFVAIGKTAIAEAAVAKIAMPSNEIFEVRGANIFYFAPPTVVKPKLNNALFEQKLSVEATSRNVNTIYALLEKMPKV